MQENNPFFGWILQENPNFWEDNGYKKINSSNFHYYGCNTAKVNKYPVYRKHLYICHDMEDDSMVEVFPCGIGVVNHDYIVAIKPYLRSMGSMSEEEKEIYYNLCYKEEELELGEWVVKTHYHDTIDSIDYLNSIHIDYRDLIPKGLAIKVTKENNPYKKLEL